MDNKIKDEIKLVWIIHIIWNIISSWIIWTLFVVLYLFLKNDIDPKVKSTCYNIINFNLSFIIYFAISFALMIVLIWFLTTPILYIIWFVIIIIWAIKHLSWDNFEYPLSIGFLKQEDLD